MLTPSAEERSQRPEIAAFRDFAILTKEKRLLLQKVKEIDAKLEILDYQLRDYLGEGGLKNVALDDLGYTIYLRRQIWARHKDWATARDVVQALMQCGLGQFVKEAYNVNSLSAHVRQLEERYKEDISSGRIKSIAERLPPELANVLNVEPTFSVVALETT